MIAEATPPATEPGGASGSFITFEGGEGCGKSTQLRILAAELAREPIVTREPGGTPYAERVRVALLAGGIAPFGTEAEAVAFAAARTDHVERVIHPSVAQGETVLCDRYVDSSRAYQREIGAMMGPLQRVAMNGAHPDLTLIFDVDPEIGIARVRARDGGLDRFEAADLAELHRRRAAFLAIAANEPSRCAVIDASGTTQEVAALVRGAITSRMPHLAFRTEGAPSDG